MDTPNGCLDQLDTILALGVALLLLPINKSTCQSHCPNFPTIVEYSFGHGKKCQDSDLDVAVVKF